MLNHYNARCASGSAQPAWEGGHRHWYYNDRHRYNDDRRGYNDDRRGYDNDRWRRGW
jgi:hypothetical protein